MQLSHRSRVRFTENQLSRPCKMYQLKTMAIRSEFKLTSLRVLVASSPVQGVCT